MNLSLIVGCSVQISRSDGRVHYASVKSIDEVKNLAMVEWQENNSLRGKEFDIGELFLLNKSLEELVSRSEEAMPMMPPAPALDKVYGSRLRSSRIPAPASSSAAAASKAEETVARKSQYISVPEPKPARPVLEPIQESSRPAVSNQPVRRKDARLGSVLPSNSFTAMEMEEPVAPPPAQPGPSAGRRKTMAYPDGSKGNKRLSCTVKQPELPTKRGKSAKSAEANRPNFKFHQMIEHFRETLEILPLSTSDLVESQRICVAVRKRPLNKKELARKDIDVVSVPGKGKVLVHEPKQKVDLTKYLENQTFHFDYSFQETATNELVYWFTAKPLVKSIFEGGMATCFAYGQTGSGKTHTMGGDFSGKSQNSAKGIYALAAQDVFSFLSQRKYASLNVSPYVTFFEIYNGKVFDLLNDKLKLRVLEDDRQQVQVVGLEEVEVSTPEDVIKLIEVGTAYRTSGQTSANANSSRSHAILQIVLRRNDRGSTLHGQFSLVDLAGNERGTDVSSTDRATMVEMAEINRSLLALKECIRSLGRNSDHIPFRESTLTKVLRDSFIGDNSRTCMIAMVAPGMPSCDYTLNTLRYADRVKGLNGTSKAGGAVKAPEPMDISSDASSDEDSVVPSMYEAMPRIQQLEDKVQEELRTSGVLLKLMGTISYDIEEGLPHLVNHARKLLDTVLALEVAVTEGQMARMPHATSSHR